MGPFMILILRIGRIVVRAFSKPRFPPWTPGGLGIRIRRVACKHPPLVFRALLFGVNDDSLVEPIYTLLSPNVRKSDECACMASGTSITHASVHFIQSFVTYPEERILCDLQKKLCRKCWTGRNGRQAERLKQSPHSYDVRYDRIC